MTASDSASLLRESGLKVTRQRSLLLDAILDSEPVFSTVSLESRVEGSMDAATVYRILAAFLQSGIIREVVSSDVIRFYELANLENRIHPHFMCTRCKRIICLESLRQVDYRNIKRYASNNDVQDISIQFTGICRECRTDENHSLDI